MSTIIYYFSNGFNVYGQTLSSVNSRVHTIFANLKTVLAVESFALVPCERRQFPELNLVVDSLVHIYNRSYFVKFACNSPENWPRRTDTQMV